jgi:hypothetical protein
MSSKRSLPDWHEDAGFRPDMSLFDGPSDKIIDKIPRKPMTTPREVMAGIKGYSGLGATNEGPNDDDKYLDDLITEMNPDVEPPSMEKIVSNLPNYQLPQGKGGASRKMRRSRKMRKSRRMRRVKSQMRRKNSSRKSTRRRTRK